MADWVMAVRNLIMVIAFLGLVIWLVIRHIRINAAMRRHPAGKHKPGGEQ